MAAPDKQPTKEMVRDVGSGSSSRDEELGEMASMKNNELKKALKNRHLQMIAMGGAIGAGLFIGSGKALSAGGPGSILICYAIIGVMMLFTCQALAELAVVYPSNGAFFEHCLRFLDPTWGFAIGWGYALTWMIILPFELVAASITIRYWNDSISMGVWVTVFLVTLSLIQIFGVRGYGEVESVLSIIKIMACTGFIILGIIINCGGVGDQGKLGTKYWVEPGAFRNGFEGFASVFVIASFSFGGTELAGLAAAESERPEKSVPKACKQVFWRICFFYVLNLFIMGLILRSDDPRLLGSGAIDTKASPFVLAIQDAGIQVLPHIMNGVITIAVISVANSSTFGFTRTVQAMATVGMAPKYLAKIDEQGRPMRCTIVLILFSMIAYIGLAPSDAGMQLFEWLLALTGVAYFFIWGSICLCHIRFRKAMKIQGLSLDLIPYKPSCGVWGSWIALTLNGLCLMASFYVCANPKPGATAAQTVEGFFKGYLAAPVMIILWLAWKVRTGSWRLQTPLHEIDLRTDAKFINPADVNREPEKQKSLPRRVLGALF
ncbi:amino acid permease/ SLC12A domain-containing protein [Triangularia verruculosa]|uniref:Amino acid permease/ SLC12A domain-containing protein n=1 Tax=Triangularia verruculosa TaxID=2587418 RepID=A0AAN6X784_9PEZI|nr:amino acid permease/ SLC12A domain-containing protein [Triangularia verruculosa]